MRIIIIFYFFVFHFNLYSQTLNSDTIQLQNINIEAKELKSKTIKLGQGNKTGHDFKNDTSIYLIENLPYGELQILTLYFTYKLQKNIKIKKTNTTIYELTLFEIEANGTVGKEINKEPLIITLGESKKTYPIKNIDLSYLHYKSSRFFIQLKRISNLPCGKCAFYIPLVQGSSNHLYYDGDAKDFKVDQEVQAKNKENYSEGLKCEIKTLTRDY